jgi:lactoylglutathione lyase
MFNSGFPILSTRDIERSLGFYRDLLGGEVYYRFPDDGPPGYVAIRVGSMQLGIGLDPDAVEGAGGQRTALWFYVSDCDAAIERLRAGGVTVTEQPQDQPWGERTARVLDPDGNEVIVAAGE